MDGLRGGVGVADRQYVFVGTLSRRQSFHAVKSQRSVQLNALRAMHVPGQLPLPARQRPSLPSQKVPPGPFRLPPTTTSTAVLAGAADSFSLGTGRLHSS